MGRRPSRIRRISSRLVCIVVLSVQVLQRGNRSGEWEHTFPFRRGKEVFQGNFSPWYAYFFLRVTPHEFVALFGCVHRSFVLVNVLRITKRTECILVVDDISEMSECMRKSKAPVGRFSPIPWIENRIRCLTGACLHFRVVDLLANNWQARNILSNARCTLGALGSS